MSFWDIPRSQFPLCASRLHKRKPCKAKDYFRRDGRIIPVCGYCQLNYTELFKAESSTYLNITRFDEATIAEFAAQEIHEA